jgi:hypothetical protein
VGGSWAIIKKIPFTPASFHTFLSSSACAKHATRLGATPSKIQWFLCFHIVQAPRMMIELSPFLTGPVAWLLSLHHSRKELLSSCGVRSWSYTRHRKLNQNCLEKTQFTRRWSMVSSTWSHRGHFSGWSSPCLALLIGQLSNISVGLPTKQSNGT